jgi:hypothetical protein
MTRAAEWPQRVMSTERIRIWIGQKKDHGVAANYFFAASSLVFGVLVVLLTFWITYFVIYMAADGLSALCDLVIEKRFHVTHTARLMLSGVFVLVLFLQYFRTAPSYWKEVPTDEKDFGPLMKATLGDYAALSPVLSHPKTVAKSVADVLLTGPRLVLGSWGKLNEARRLKGMNETACAHVLALVYSRPDAVPYEELCSAGWGRQLLDLKTIDGYISWRQVCCYRMN